MRKHEKSVANLRKGHTGPKIVRLGKSAIGKLHIEQIHFTVIVSDNLKVQTNFIK